MNLRTTIVAFVSQSGTGHAYRAHLVCTEPARFPAHIRGLWATAAWVHLYTCNGMKPRLDNFARLVVEEYRDMMEA